MRNPFAIDAIAPVTATALGVLFVITAPLIALRAASLIVRFGRARGDERQQLKWFAYAGALTVPAIAGEELLGDTVPDILFPVAILLLPIAAGIAILKYRLYEIDLLINRTLVCGPLTAILAGACVASVGLSQRLFVALTGETLDAAIVLTTLVVAAVFTPVKNRL